MSGAEPTHSGAEPVYDIAGRGIPRFVSRQYISLTNIDRISRFRSSVGHSYTDSAEPCRSMKHYFALNERFDPATLLISAPVDGTVRRLEQEFNGAGVQLSLQPADQPAFRIIVFHLTPSIPLAEGTTVSAGQLLGAMTGSTLSDVAVGVDTPQGYRLVSWFEVITDAVFEEYRAKGIAARDDMIVSRAARDADPLTCSEEAFTTSDTLASWVPLR